MQTATPTLPRRRAGDLGRRGAALTERELQTLTLLADGRESSEIAAAIGLTVRTFRNVRLGLFAKLGARSDSHAAAIAFRCGILSTDRRTTVEYQTSCAD